MDFHLTNEQQMLRKMYREFAENEVKPLAEEIDEEERFPMETVEKMAKLGMMGIYFPKEYGGAGGDVLSYAMCVEELAKVCGTTAVIVSAHTSLCCAPIFEHGTEEQKRKYLPDLLSGKKIGAFGLTEPNAGTDASGQQTLAVLEGDHYVLNGSKCFITNGNVADTFVVFAMTDKSKGNHGISAFIVEKDFPGFSTGKHEKKMGIRGSSTCDLIFEDCIVPKENLLGKEGQGFKIAMMTLDGGRIGIAAQALGLGEGAVEEAIKDPAVKGMWNVPKYSNPDGIIYSAETIRRIASMKPAAPDFLLMWDNAYCIHEFEGDYVEFPDILAECEKYGNADMVFEFASTSKVTLPGAGISCFACSEANMAYMEKLLTVQVISFDKVNQQRHVLYLKDKAHTLELMKKHAAIMGPKFRCVVDALDREIAPLEIASWRRPKGGYFVSLNAMPGTAKRTLALCKEAGVTMTGAGATFPYGKDPQDSNIRIAPSLPPVEELEQAIAVLCVCLKMAALEKLGV